MHEPEYHITYCSNACICILDVTTSCLKNVFMMRPYLRFLPAVGAARIDDEYTRPQITPLTGRPSTNEGDLSGF
jgi:hypothetical protein